jgi:signal transduction histidine kinase
MTWLIVGFLCGLAVAAPVAYYGYRRSERRARQYQQRARAAERLAELGTLTGGLAHEIKNPLSTIGLNLQLLGETLEQAALPDPVASRMRSRLEALVGETTRLRGILEDFLAFAGRMKLDPQPTDINRLIEELIDFYHAQAEASGVRFVLQLDPGAGQVRLDSRLVKQALLNLLINATQAMVEARYSGKPHGGSSELIVRTKPRSGDVDIHVIDNGPGIDPEGLKKLFRPYFSTRRGGTGLGLATSRRIAHEHGGELWVHTEIGRGCDFTLQLPRQGPPVDFADA